jgi:hypothetical protein
MFDHQEYNNKDIQNDGKIFLHLFSIYIFLNILESSRTNIVRKSASLLNMKKMCMGNVMFLDHQEYNNNNNPVQQYIF